MHPAQGAVPIGRLFVGRFILTERLGGGESGDFFAALDTATEGDGSPAEIVIKVAHACDAPSHEAFRLEYNQARRLSNPNIARVYDFFADPESIGYTLELPRGAPLANSLPTATDQRLDSNFAWAVIAATGRALVHAHLRDVMHGALSMRSLWITEDRQLRVLDFGSGPSRSGAPSSDVERYASGEVLAGFSSTASDDLYSLSCLAYELLSGRHPWDGSNSTVARNLNLRPARPPGLKSATWRTLKAGLALTRDRRPPSVREWLAALHLASKHERLPELKLSPVPTMRFGREPVIALASVAALGLCAAGWQISHPTGPSAGQTGPAANLVASRASATSSPTSRVDASPAAPNRAAVPGAASALPSSAANPALAPALVPATAAPTGAVAAAASVAPIGVAAGGLAAGKGSSATAHGLPIGDGLWFSQAQYRYAGGSRFVEVHVLRRGAAAAGFQWWTEADTALEGEDFQPQTPAMQSLKPQASGTSFFVRIPATRHSHRSFRVCVRPDSGSGAAAHACAKILL